MSVCEILFPSGKNCSSVTLLKETFAEVQRELLVALYSIFVENFIQNFQ